MNKNVPKCNDAGTISNTFSQLAVQPRELRQGFANDRELALYCSPQNFVGKVLFEALTGRESCEGGSMLRNVVKIRFRVRPHTAAFWSALQWQGSRDS
jgi:hypothetical protein